MQPPPLPRVGIGDADVQHRHDEELGFGLAVERALEVRGYSNPRLYAWGTDARVYEARSASGMRLAIRVPARFAVIREKSLADWSSRFRNWLLCRLPIRHVNLVECLDTGILAYADPEFGHRLNLPYLVMAFVEGRRLRDALQDGELVKYGPARLRQVWLGIMAGMVALHRRGLRHGDLSPANVLVRDTNGEPVIVDLRFSTHLGRKLDHDRNDLHRTLREILTGTWQLSREPSTVTRKRVLEYWAPWCDDPSRCAELLAWLELADSIAAGGALARAGPSQIWAASRELAERQT